jgi:hypothetical protein
MNNNNPEDFSKMISSEVIELLQKRVLGPDGKPVPVKSQIAEKIVEKLLDGDEKMIRLVWAYIEGSPTQRIEQNTNTMIVNTVWTPEQIMAMRETQRLMNANVVKI